MHFDDRLATVLRHRAAGARAARTQFRQLLDLLGRSERARDENLVVAACVRLGSLGELIPTKERAAIICEAGLRFRSLKLVAHFAEQEPEVAAAALSAARLEDEEWETLIPRLPVRARGFLRLRSDLSPTVNATLERLGVHDRGLPMPLAAEPEGGNARPAAPPASPPAKGIEQEDASIGTLVRRIAAFQRARGEEAPADAELAEDGEAPLLPLGQADTECRPAPGDAFSFTTDADGAIDWADEGILPMVFGLRLREASVGGSQIDSLMTGKQPLRGVKLSLAGAPPVTGEWVVDAAPRFTTGGGRFVGYAGMFRRQTQRWQDAGSARSESADRLRQLLHELRTPVNAVQGFAEVIQQQFFGPVPHQYRALAANIAGDAARILAGFDELERLARLESGGLRLEDGESDVVAMIRSMAAQLEETLAGRQVDLSIECAATGCLVAVGSDDLEVLAWRFLSTLADAAEKREEIGMDCRIGDGTFRLAGPLPRLLAERESIFDAVWEKERPLRPGAGMFGYGFSLRLARSEARAAGGELRRSGSTIELLLPTLTEGRESGGSAEKRNLA